MNSTIIDVPAMYADHHVLRVRQALLDIEGVAEVVASAARRKVAVSFDEKAASPEALRAALATAGYPPDQIAGDDRVPEEARGRLGLVHGPQPHDRHRAQGSRDGRRFPPLLAVKRLPAFYAC